jgi:predicted DNA binding CopG/RHH family protein
MKKARKKVIPKKKRGRPATGKDPLVALRLPDSMIAAIDRAAESDGVSRSEKIRRLIEKSL